MNATPAGSLSLRTQVAALLWKEVRQLPRKRAALISAVLLPMLFFVVLPAGQMIGLSQLGSAATPTPVGVPEGLPLPDTLQIIERDPAAAFRLLTLPLVVLVGGLIVPSVMAVHTVVVERERRTLDLLAALPVSLPAILWAKLLATLAVGAAIAVPLFAVDCLLALRLRLLTPANAATLLALLLAALTYSTAAALVVGLVAGDFRTANNVSGAMIGPLILLAVACLILLPPGIAPLLLAALLLGLAGIAVVAALRWLTVERLLR
ncbi:MAG: ABC transporter permease [Chloroflexota bacterium]